jgi:hypothetical protein
MRKRLKSAEECAASLERLSAAVEVARFRNDHRNPLVLMFEEVEALLEVLVSRVHPVHPTIAMLAGETPAAEAQAAASSQAPPASTFVEAVERGPRTRAAKAAVGPALPRFVQLVVIDGDGEPHTPEFSFFALDSEGHVWRLADRGWWHVEGDHCMWIDGKIINRYNPNDDGGGAA